MSVDDILSVDLPPDNIFKSAAYGRRAKTIQCPLAVKKARAEDWKRRYQEAIRMRGYGDADNY